jgi:uncharacterized membrane protein YraQ (UPF0718 family)
MNQPQQTGMIAATALMAVLAVALVWYGFQRNPQAVATGLKTGARQLVQVLPLVVFTFIVIGMLAVLVPRELIERWIGTHSGFKGIFIGSLAGAVAPGGPVIQAIIGAGVFKAGASIGAVVAFLTGGVLWRFTLIPVEVGILGWRIVAIRLACTFFFPPIAGLLAQAMFGGAAR